MTTLKERLDFKLETINNLLDSLARPNEVSNASIHWNEMKIAYTQLIRAVEALEEMKAKKPYRCWTCDGGERFVDLAEEALAEIEKGIES